MSQATIIPFPCPDVKFAERERLRCAMFDLQNAVAEQKEAMSQWRFAMAELSIGVAGLGQSLSCYQDSLAGVDTQLGSLRAEAVRLQATAGAITDAAQPSV